MTRHSANTNRLLIWPRPEVHVVWVMAVSRLYHTPYSRPPLRRSSSWALPGGILNRTGPGSTAEGMRLLRFAKN